jgi:hypothetical protein
MNKMESSWNYQLVFCSYKTWFSCETGYNIEIHLGIILMKKAHLQIQVDVD